MRCVPCVLLAALACLPAAEPELVVNVDVATLRNQATTTAPAMAWVGDPGLVALRQRLNEAATLDPSLMPVMAVLDAASVLTAERTGSSWAVAAVDAGATWATWAKDRPVAKSSASKEVVAWSWQAQPTLLRCAQRGLELPFHDWRNSDMTLEGSWKVQDGAWSASTRLTSRARLALAPAEVSAVDDSALVAIATTIEPEVLAAVLSRNLHPGHRRFLEDRLGKPLAQMAGLLDGRVLLRVDPGELLPSVLLSLGLRPGVDGQALVQALSDSFRGQGTTLAGANRAVRLSTPLGPWFAACSDTRLVIGSDPSRLSARLAAAVEAPGDLLLKARADLPTLARRFLPLAFAGWSGTPLVPDPLPALVAHLDEVAQAQVQASSSLMAGLAPGATLTLHRGAVERTWSLAPAVQQGLTALLGSDPATRVAVYAPAEREDQIQTVLRTEAGWLVVADLRRGFTTPVTAEAATRRVRDLGATRLVLGRPLADLDPIVRPVVPVLDPSCFPAPERLAQVLRPWTAEIRATAEGALITEQGLPLLNVMGLTAAAFADRIPVAQVSGPTTEL